MLNKKALIPIAWIVVAALASCGDSSEPLPPLKVVNRTEEPLLVRFDIVLQEDESTGGFGSHPPSDSSIWKFRVDPSTETMLDISMNGRYPIDLTGVIRVAAITELGTVFLNQSFTPLELSEMDWTLLIGS